MACPASVPCDLVDANLDFTVSLYSHLVSTNCGNIFFAPISISIAFALIHCGARGNTATQIEDVLKFGKVNNLHEAFRTLQESINSALHKSALHLANRLFGNDQYHFLQAYLDQSLHLYKAELQPLNFAGDPDGSRKVINDWVESKTANKIKDLIPADVINSLTALILVNAIYFKGEWKDKFNESSTHKADFHLSESEKVSIDFMQKKHKYPISFDDNLDATVIELPYNDDNLSMFVFLPNQKFLLSSLENKLNAEEMKRILTNKLHSMEIILKFPKFKFEQKINLHEVLPTLGLKDLFNRNLADLSGVSGVNELYVSKAIHKAFVEVNEEGTEAAAATAAIMMLRSMPRPPREITVDHPFIFAIVQKKLSTVLFIGRVSDPSV